MKSTIAFGLSLAALAGGAHLLATRSIQALQDDLNRAPVYQLTMEVDGDYYIVDSDITRTACQQMLKTVMDWTSGQARYTCDRQPEESRR